MSDSWNLITSAVMRGLPDNVSERRETLNALIQVMPTGSQSARRAAEILSHLDIHIISARDWDQMELALSPQPKRKK